MTAAGATRDVPHGSYEGFLKANVPSKGSLQPFVDLYNNVWTPLLQGWQAFFAANKGWWDNFW